MTAPHPSVQPAPAFVQSPAKSFRTFLAEGGRDPRVDPQPGDVVGIRTVGRVREMHVEQVAYGRVRGTTLARDGGCEREGVFEVTIEAWRSGNAAVSVFVVAGEGADA